MWLTRNAALLAPVKATASVISVTARARCRQSIKPTAIMKMAGTMKPGQTKQQ